ncbi:putative bifunctional diguanylate cyclase/phosphodiesterase [Sporomusa acidovorans]|uniref:Cyclic di-GMP phosphodiesterase Gmr n=1 Tax=Sporomusa acidovorans (strain ATCC 49682 / DSM 3132 / Mol) TaxID=1123286 RepID=A0ABZ3IVI6_SPOA4|nr:GGDEF domain-containing phosphodiesterase [Sporomusa acidovorans]OZC15271.1 phytochrome-like protein cph2 [Sporomusa acidovorans DSM 3132]SDE91715.1 PAS domain S-box-containing protein/diguanylate cyclase (GGDEF) domain-containing protein [Sporomusa acidovorans]
MLGEFLSYMSGLEQWTASLCTAIVILGAAVIYLLVRVKTYRRTVGLLQQQNEELATVHEELAAQEEELRRNYNELYQSEEIIRQHDELFRLVTEGSNDGLWQWDIITDSKTLSERGWSLLGLPEKAVTTKEQWKKELVHPEDLPRMMAELESHLSAQKPFYHIEYRVKSASGAYRWILSRGKALFDGSGKPVRMAGSYTDITDRKFKEERIKHMAYYDALTGLANRERLKEIVSETLPAAAKNGKQGAIIFIDIDNFKLINDTYGHSWGDKLLVSFSVRLAALVAEVGMAARLGGDEIVVFLPAMERVEEITAYAGRIMQLLEQPFAVNGHIFHVTASAGIAIYPEHGDNVEELLRNADMAMYSAKTSGKHTFRFFDKSMHDLIVEKTLLEARLREAVPNKELKLYYQPQCNMKIGQMEGFEALLRWQSPVYGIVSPLKFIPLAEETGLIIAIGKWVLKEACAFCQGLYVGGQGRLWAAVNISVVQLIQDNFVQLVADVLAETGLPPEYLELEITESVLMEQFEDNIRKLQELRRMGVRIALDDFGSGYSSLTYLKKLPITALKIDKAFIEDITFGDTNTAITGSIIELAHEMGLVVVAEGVETKTQFSYLKQKDCDMIQGYFISPPLAAEEFTAKLRE